MAGQESEIIRCVTWEQLGVVLVCLLGLLILVARLTGQVLFGKQMAMVVDRVKRLRQKQDEIHREVEALNDKIQTEARRLGERISRIEGQLGL